MVRLVLPLTPAVNLGHIENIKDGFGILEDLVNTSGRFTYSKPRYDGAVSILTTQIFKLDISLLYNNALC